MKILGIHDGHTASACLFEDGKILGMASEERFTKTKNKGGFPFHTILWLLDEFNVSPSDIDQVVFPGHMTPISGVSDNLHRHRNVNLALKVIPKGILTSLKLTNMYIQKQRKKRESLVYHKEPIEKLALSNSEIRFIEHHTCHATTAYFLDNNFSKDEKTLVLTLDGSGDGLSATVSIGHNNKLERIKNIHSYNSLGLLYSRTTAYLGMKPLEHEYKLMGMAPYAPDFLVEKSYEVFKKYIKLDDSGLSFENTSGVYGNAIQRKMQKDLYLHRFDGICGGLQRITEELVLEWIQNWVNHTGIKKIALAGGVFMNVKLNMLINEKIDLKSVFFMPSCGDETVALGAALQAYSESDEIEKQPIEPLQSLYHGPEYTDEEIEKVLRDSTGFEFTKPDDINDVMAGLLAEGQIVARVHGRMEFGARSLGNRSILSNPDSYDRVSKINRAIKKRDFWMPFAPSMLESGAKKYLVSKKDTKKARFMIIGYDTTQLGRDEVKAGIHQSDFTCRPQVVTEQSNPEYYDLLRKFEEKTGVSAVMNTSFNIHGFPIVNGPDEALWTLENSGLDAVQIGGFLVRKKDGKTDYSQTSSEELLSSIGIEVLSR